MAVCVACEQKLDSIPEIYLHQLLHNLRLLVIAYDNMTDHQKFQLTTAAEVTRTVHHPLGPHQVMLNLDLSCSVCCLTACLADHQEPRLAGVAGGAVCGARGQPGQGRGGRPAAPPQEQQQHVRCVRQPCLHHHPPALLLHANGCASREVPPP